MDRQKLQEQVQAINSEFHRDLEVLYAQGVVKQIDVQKIKNQIEVSKTALFESLNRNDFSSEIQGDLISSLLMDYELSIQKIIDSAILRLGADALVSYKFNKVDEKVNIYADEQKFSKLQKQLLQGYMAGARAYALRTLPAKPKYWDTQKIDFPKIVNDYSSILEDFVQELRTGNERKHTIVLRS